MAEDKKHIQIGFTSGQTIPLKLDPAEYDKLIKAIKDETDWHEVKTEKGTLVLRADKIDFYGIEDEKEERRAGF